MPCGLSFLPKRAMSDFKYTDQPLSYKLAMQVGDLLRQAQIPHILWGEKMFDLLLLNSNVGVSI